MAENHVREPRSAESHVREGSIERICVQHEVSPGAGADEEPDCDQPKIYRGESFLGFLSASKARQRSPKEGTSASEAENACLLASCSEECAPEMNIHTFKVVVALSGDLLASINLPMTPPPTAGQLRAELQKMDHRGNLVKLGQNDVLQDDEVFTGLEPGGETDIGLIKGNFIEVHEAGYYNGVYEQIDTNEGRPAYRMTVAHNARAGERYIYYSSKGQQIVPGWKFNDRYVPKVSEWDMLAPLGPGTHAAKNMKDDIPEGKFRLDNGGTNTKPNAPRITKSLTRGTTQDDISRLARAAAVEEQENIEGTEAGGCFGGDAKLLMADGSHKQARDVRVGDLLMSASDGGQGQLHHMGKSRGGDGCTTTKVEACVVEARDIHQLVQIGDLLITPHHPVVQDGRWTLPGDVQGAKHIDADMELFNFITTNREAIHVEGFVATSIGTYCEGLHDIEQNAEHRIWGTDAIVRIYQQHPQWPNITSATEEIMAAVEAVKEGASIEGASHQLWRSHENCPAKACAVTEKSAQAELQTSSESVQ